MAPKHEQLAAMSDEDLIARYNGQAENTVVGTAFYREELARRQMSRGSARMLSLTKTMARLTWVILALTAVNAGLVLVQLLKPGKPNQNAYIERFNRTFREEVLGQHLFTRLDDVREAVYWWMLDYNEQRPHDSLGDLTPLEYCQTVTSSTFEMSA